LAKKSRSGNSERFCEVIKIAKIWLGRSYIYFDRNLRLHVHCRTMGTRLCKQ
jgi:hypothetical protein